MAEQNPVWNKTWQYILLGKNENNSAEKEGFPYAPDRLCSMHYDTGSYSAGCKEKIDVDEAVL